MEVEGAPQVARSGLECGARTSRKCWRAVGVGDERGPEGCYALEKTAGLRQVRAALAATSPLPPPQPRTVVQAAGRQRGRRSLLREARYFGAVEKSCQPIDLRTGLAILFARPQIGLWAWARCLASFTRGASDRANGKGPSFSGAACSGRVVAVSASNVHPLSTLPCLKLAPPIQPHCGLGAHWRLGD